jgi:hypothetical protein
MMNDTGERLTCESVDGICFYCRTLPATTADHLHAAGDPTTKPKSKTCVPSCGSCNSSKGKREFGLWMVNKFGFNDDVLHRICQLSEGSEEGEGDNESERDAADAVEGSETAVGGPAQPDPHMMAALRGLCYRFCDELHSLVLDCKARPKEWRDVMWRDVEE